MVRVMSLGFIKLHAAKQAHAAKQPRAAKASTCTHGNQMQPKQPHAADSTTCSRGNHMQPSNYMQSRQPHAADASHAPTAITRSHCNHMTSLTRLLLSTRELPFLHVYRDKLIHR